jgi:hypothetical protein
VIPGGHGRLSLPERRTIVKLRALVLCFGIALLAGCGGGGVPVEGKVTKGGQPYDPAKDGDINVGLRGNKDFSGKAGADGSFKIDNVPPGKYTVTATIYPAAGAAAGAKGPPMASSKQLDEQWEVSSSNKSFTLDVAKLKDSAIKK